MSNEQQQPDLNKLTASSVIDDLRSLKQKIKSGEPIEATRVNLETGEQTSVVLRSRPDLDKLAASVARDWCDVDDYEDIKQAVLDALTTATAPLEQRVRELEQQLESERTDLLARALRAEQELFACQGQLSQARKQLESERTQWTAELAKATDQRLSAERRAEAAEKIVEEWQSSFTLFRLPDPNVKPIDVARRLENAEHQRDELLLKVAQLEGKQPEGFAKMFAMKARQERLEARDRDSVWRQVECDRCKKQMVYDNGDERDLTATDVESVECWNCGAVKVFDSRMPEDTADELAEETFEPPHSMSKRLAAAQARIAELEEQLGESRKRLLSAAGDDLCRLSQEEIKAMTDGAVPIPPKDEFIASCEKFHAQVAGEAGVNQNCLTLAQLVAENEKQRQQLATVTAERDVFQDGFAKALEKLKEARQKYEKLESEFRPKVEGYIAIERLLQNESAMGKPAIETLCQACSLMLDADNKRIAAEQRVRELEQQLESERTDLLARALRAEQELFACQGQLSQARKQLESERTQWTAELAKATDQRLSAERRAEAAEKIVEEWQSSFTLFCLPDPNVKPIDVVRRLENAESQRGELLLKVAQLEGKQPEGFAKLFAMKARQDRLETRDGYSVWRQVECDRCKRQMVYDNGDERDLTMTDVESVKCWNCGAVNVFSGALDDEACELAEETFEPPHSMSKRLKTAQARIAELESELEQGFADQRRIDEARIAEFEQQLSQPPWQLMAERESLKKQVELLLAAQARIAELEQGYLKLQDSLQAERDSLYRERQNITALRQQVELLRAACVRTKEILDSWGPERWGCTLELLHERLEAALAATEKPHDQ